MNRQQVRNLLSPYLDGQVTPEEQSLVEEALAASPELQQELASLRQTVTMLAALPRVPAPRAFTLSEAMVGKAAPQTKGFWGLPNWAIGWASAALTLLCVLAAGSYFLSMQFEGNSMQVAAPAQEAALLPSATVIVETEALAPPQPEAKEAAVLPQDTAAQENMSAAGAAAPEEPPVDEASVAAQSQTSPPAETEQSVAADSLANSAEIAPTALPEATVVSAYAAPATEPLEDQAMTANGAPAPPDGPGVGGGGEAPEGLQQKAEPAEAQGSTAAMAQPAQEVDQAAANGAEPESAAAPAEQTEASVEQAEEAATQRLAETAILAPTATLTPAPSATPLAMLTLPVPTATTTPVIASAAVERASESNFSWALWLVGIALLLGVIGLFIWLRNKK
jgi:hypothetical protein